MNLKGRILIVDDEEGIRYTSRAFLTKEGHEVTTAESYDFALKTLSETEYDLIFMDIILGGHSGMDLLREVKKRGLRCPVIMITGEPNLDTASESVRLGAFDYVAKPLVKRTLLHLTQLALHHKNLADEKAIAEEERERYRLDLEAIFRSVQDAIVTVDDDMRVIGANEAARAICGIDPEESKGRSFAELGRRCSASCIEVIRRTLGANDTVRESRVECGRPESPRQIVELTGSPLLDRMNKPRGAVLVVRDITRLDALEKELKERHGFQRIIGRSEKMQEVYKLLDSLADTDTTVLIRGESGTGKELVADALHYGGVRAAKPMIEVNCSALAENLLESELFGHVRGAYTGAVRDKTGRFEAANGGTIFLDEIGDVSPRIQLKLLRVLQEKEFERVGDSRPVRVDVRVIAATNRNLKEKIRRGEFREDLYYRLKVVEIMLPPLRDRLDDIPLLADHFCSLFGNKFRKEIQGVSDEALRALMYYRWPGNVREFMHAIEHGCLLSRGEVVTLADLPPEIREQEMTRAPKQQCKARLTRESIIDALNKTDWNKAKAGRILGVARQTIHRKIDELGLRRTDAQ